MEAKKVVFTFYKDPDTADQKNNENKSWDYRQKIHIQNMGDKRSYGVRKTLGNCGMQRFISKNLALRKDFYKI